MKGQQYVSPVKETEIESSLKELEKNTKEGDSKGINEKENTQLRSTL